MSASRDPRTVGTVGIVGIGAMGRGFAKNLLEAGFRVQGFDLDPVRLAELEERGGHVVQNPAEAAHGASWVLTSLPDHETVREVLFGVGGIVDGAEPGTIVVDTSTSLPQQSQALAGALDEHGIRFVDASVSGTGATVLHKDVVVLAGGDAGDVAACRTLFDGFCRQAYHLGPVGSGALGKLVINVAVVGNRLALAEALTFGTQAGVDPEVMLQILKDGPSYSRAMDLKGEKMIRGDYRPESTLFASWHGCELLLEQGRGVGAPMFLTSLYAQVAQIAVGLGYGDADPAALIEALRHVAHAKRRE